MKYDKIDFSDVVENIRNFEPCADEYYSPHLSAHDYWKIREYMYMDVAVALIPTNDFQRVVPVPIPPMLFKRPRPPFRMMIYCRGDVFDDYYTPDFIAQNIEEFLEEEKKRGTQMKMSKWFKEI